MKRSLLLYGLFFCLSARSQEAADHIKKGNDYYKRGQFVKAAEEYNKAIQTDPGNQTAKFNLANAFYKQDNKVGAAEILTGLTTTAGEKGLLSKVFYNKGVILSGQKNLEGSIEAYKNALKNNPDDKEARENLQKALLELKKKTPPPPKKKEDQKKKQQQQKQSQSRLSPKEAEQRLKLLEQKEKQVQQKVQSERSKTGGGQGKDW